MLAGQAEFVCSFSAISSLCFCHQYADMSCQQTLSTYPELNADINDYGSVIKSERICCQFAQFVIGESQLHATI